MDTKLELTMDIKAGDILIAKKGTSCLKFGKEYLVYSQPSGMFSIVCEGNDGDTKHYITLGWRNYFTRKES